MLENQIFGLFLELGPDDEVALLMGGLLILKITGPSMARVHDGGKGTVGIGKGPRG